MGESSTTGVASATQPHQRQQTTQPAHSTESIKEAEVEESKDEDHVYGKTPDGTTFTVPHTEDMVTNLLDPRVRKSPSDIAIVAVLSSYVLLYAILPSSWRIPVYVMMFAFWRLGYNAGIGWLLRIQSNNRQLTKWARKYKLFDSKQTSMLHKLVKKDLVAKMNPQEYDFDKAPLEYNTWLLYRDVVDLILMSDFTCYMMLAFSCASRTDHSWLVTAGRWGAGIGLFLFNIWVKLDAHRVVKDYAWYWGDFFFLVEADLTFDGVFEMAPHPMYSIGYAGYYGISLMTASYTVFFCSIFAHLLQGCFLYIVEEPHIVKIYDKPEPVKKPNRKASDAASNSVVGSSPRLDDQVDESIALRTTQPGMILFKGFNITRVGDLLLLLLAVNTGVQVFLPDSFVWCGLTFLSALSWRLFQMFGLGYILHKQSTRKSWTRLFLKYGKTTMQAYEQWQVLYNACTVMSGTSLVVFAIRQWSSPLGVPFWTFRYILGVMLIALQTWSSLSIYESLGEYGWFFGDFFFPQKQQLTYSGIYRYLNNPDRLLGIAGVWGLALLTNSTGVTILAFIYHSCAEAQYRLVELPHMRKLYGEQIRQDSGVVKTIRHAKFPIPLSPLESHLKKLTTAIDTVISDAAAKVEDFLDQTTPKLASNVRKRVDGTKVMLKQAPAKLTIVRVSDEIKADPSLYSLEFEGGEIEYGKPIQLKWKSDLHRTETDWIGLYRITANTSTEVTRVSSRGRWVPVDQRGFESRPGVVRTGHTSGEVVFEADQLFWEKGVYEFRYHHNGKHNVLAISKPFEIVTTPVDIASPQFKPALLGLVQRCCHGANVYAPQTTEEVWDFDNNKQVISRLAYGVHQVFGVDLAPVVFKIDENVEQLGSRLIQVDEALRPFVGYSQVNGNGKA